MSDSLIKLNLGCGPRQQEGLPEDDIKGWTNVDGRAMNGVDIVHDFNVFPWPWDDNSVDEINASHVIEHLTDPLVAIMEMHRILKSNGKITIRVPHKDGFFACAIGHFHYFSMQWFENLKGLNCQQNDIGNDKFKNHSIYLNMFVPRVPWSPLVQFLIHRWEKYFNKNRSRQLAWEVLGIFHPGEIVWKAQKF